MSAVGVVIAESLRVPSELSLRTTRVERVAPGNAVPGQPRDWTLLHIEVADGSEDQLALSLAAALKPEGGWYADFRTDETAWVIYADRVFSYARGDAGARAEAIAYGRERGVPEPQLDWPV